MPAWLQEEDTNKKVKPPQLQQDPWAAEMYNTDDLEEEEMEYELFGGKNVAEEFAKAFDETVNQFADAPRAFMQGLKTGGLTLSIEGSALRYAMLQSADTEGPKSVSPEQAKEEFDIDIDAHISQREAHVRQMLKQDYMKDLAKWSDDALQFERPVATLATWGGAAAAFYAMPSTRLFRGLITKSLVAGGTAIASARMLHSAAKVGQGVEGLNKAKKIATAFDPVIQTADKFTKWANRLNPTIKNVATVTAKEGSVNALEAIGAHQIEANLGNKYDVLGEAALGFFAPAIFGALGALGKGVRGVGEVVNRAEVEEAIANPKVQSIGPDLLVKRDPAPYRQSTPKEPQKLLAPGKDAPLQLTSRTKGLLEEGHASIEETLSQIVLEARVKEFTGKSDIEILADRVYKERVKLFAKSQRKPRKLTDKQQKRLIDKAAKRELYGPDPHLTPKDLNQMIQDEFARQQHMRDEELAVKLFDSLPQPADWVARAIDELPTSQKTPALQLEASKIRTIAMAETMYGPESVHTLQKLKANMVKAGVDADPDDIYTFMRDEESFLAKVDEVGSDADFESLFELQADILNKGLKETQPRKPKQYIIKEAAQPAPKVEPVKEIADKVTEAKVVEQVQASKDLDNWGDAEIFAMFQKDTADISRAAKGGVIENIGSKKKKSKKKAKAIISKEDITKNPTVIKEAETKLDVFKKELEEKQGLKIGLMENEATGTDKAGSRILIGQYDETKSWRIEIDTKDGRIKLTHEEGSKYTLQDATKENRGTNQAKLRKDATKEYKTMRRAFKAFEKATGYDPDKLLKNLKKMQMLDTLSKQKTTKIGFMEGISKAIDDVDGSFKKYKQCLGK